MKLNSLLMIILIFNPFAYGEIKDEQEIFFDTLCNIEIILRQVMLSYEHESLDGIQEEAKIEYNANILAQLLYRITGAPRGDLLNAMIKNITKKLDFWKYAKDSITKNENDPEEAYNQITTYLENLIRLEDSIKKGSSAELVSDLNL